VGHRVLLSAPCLSPADATFRPVEALLLQDTGRAGGEVRVVHMALVAEDAWMSFPHTGSGPGGALSATRDGDGPSEMNEWS